MLALIGSVRLRWVETGADGADGGGNFTHRTIFARTGAAPATGVLRG